MRPMPRFLLTFLKWLRWLGLGLSTIVFVATLVLWVRSWGHDESWTFIRFEPRPDWTAPELAGEGIVRGWMARAVHGRLWLVSETGAPEPEFKPVIMYRREVVSADTAEQTFSWCFKPGERPGLSAGTDRAWRFAGAGFRCARGAVDPRTRRPTNEGFTLALPFWMLAVAFGLWPGFFVARRLLRKRRHAAGHCPACGYDLRATPDRCPECGRAVTKTTTP